MKKRYRIITVMLMLVCLVMSNLQVMAADDRLGTVVDGSLLTEDSTAEGIAYPKARGLYLSSGTGRLTIQSSRTVCMSGSTNAYQSVDEIKVTLMLQRLEGNSWATVATLGPKTAYNTYTVSNSKTYSVTGGYYYRVKGSHVVNEGSTSEAVASCSSAIWVE